MRGTVWMLFCSGLKAARLPSAKVTRSEIDEPPRLNFTSRTSWVRSGWSSSSSRMPVKVPAGVRVMATTGGVNGSRSGSRVAGGRGCCGSHADAVPAPRRSAPSTTRADAPPTSSVSTSNR